MGGGVGVPESINQCETRVVNEGASAVCADAVFDGDALDRNRSAGDNDS